jgi:hypothetical protein
MVIEMTRTRAVRRLSGLHRDSSAAGRVAEIERLQWVADSPLFGPPASSPEARRTPGLLSTLQSRKPMGQHGRSRQNRQESGAPRASPPSTGTTVGGLTILSQETPLVGSGFLREIRTGPQEPKCRDSRTE